MAPPDKLAVQVDKPTPYTFDLALLLAIDPNPLALPPSRQGDDLERVLAHAARDGAQALVNQLLTTCPVTSSPDGVHLTLPPAGGGASTPLLLPREKPLPAPRAPTRWERFAKKKGLAPKTRDQRRNLAFDEETQQWRPRWGLGGINKKGQDGDWLVEVDVKKEAELKEKGATLRSEGRRERKENVRRNERLMRRNLKDAEKVGRK
jgi:regulator of ribosome biosynthesis